MAGRRPLLVLAVTGLLAALAGCGSPRPGATATSPQEGGATATTLEPPYEPPPPVLAVAPPARLEIPAIGLSTALVNLGLNPNGTMQVPADFGVAGWYSFGPRPGEDGPAVVAGHIDSRRGPAVFYRLRELAPYDEIFVERVDGSVARFIVHSLARFPKTDFPTDTVFGPATGPVLRLITCDGAFDTSRRSYVDNLIVAASLA